MTSKATRALDSIHASLSLLMPFLVFALVGCKSGKSEQPFSFGPESPIEDVKAALIRPLQNNDPTKIKLGEFVHFAEIQTINGQYESVLSDTGQTVVARDETDDYIVFTVIENRINYSQNGQRKVSRELELPIKKSQNAPATEAETEGSVEDNSLPFNHLAYVERILSTDANPLKTFAEVFAVAKQERVTFHNLRTSFATVAPPKAVADQPNCLGIPDCKIRMNHVAFDQVIWDANNKGEKIALEFSISEDVPYLANLMNKCATLMASLNNSDAASSRVLVRQCSPVLNFHFEEQPKSTAEAQL